LHGILHVHHEGTDTESVLFAVAVAVVFALVLFYGFTLFAPEAGALLIDPNLGP
jgi:hypothetical protein